MKEDLAKTSGGGGRGLPLKADMEEIMRKSKGSNCYTRFTKEYHL